MSTIGWQRIRIPPVERVVLADLAMRRGTSDEATLAAIIREAARREAEHRGCPDREAERAS